MTTGIPASPGYSCRSGTAACQAEFPEILETVRAMAHGCTSSAWTLGFYTLHNWMLALFGEQAQNEVFDAGPVLCPAPLAPTGRAIPEEVASD